MTRNTRPKRDLSQILGEGKYWQGLAVCVVIAGVVGAAWQILLNWLFVALASFGGSYAWVDYLGAALILLGGFALIWTLE